MPPEPTLHADQTSSPSGFENYLVVAEQMGLGCYSLAISSAQSEEDAFAVAALALEPGCRPLAGFTAAELRRLADDLCARELPPGRSFNLTNEMTDEEMAEEAVDGGSDDEENEELERNESSKPLQSEAFSTKTDHPICQTTSRLYKNKTAPNALEEILQPLVDLLNEHYRGHWEGKYAICRDGAFKPLGDVHCALVELPPVPTEYPEVAQALSLLLALSETCFYAYEGRPEGEEGPVCGPCRFSVVKKALADGWFDYFHSTHLFVERLDLSEQAAKAQVAHLCQEMRAHPDEVDFDHGAF